MSRICIAWYAAVALTTGCTFKVGATSATDGATGSGGSAESDAMPFDAAPDVSPDVTPPTVDCFGTSGLALVCLQTLPAGQLTLDVATSIDTDTSDKCAALQSGSSDVCVIAGTALTLSAPVSVTGMRPLVLLSLGAMTINKPLDVASHRGSPEGPSGDASPCNAGVDPTGGGGGQGGSFGSTGGNGGDSEGSTDRGRFGAITTPTTLRGGCIGADGGGSPGSRGHGGGALLMIANTITISGEINASGSPGAGAPAGRNGGGGAGSGGMIVFDAVTITVSAPVHANGGGGGGGSSNSTAGSPGSEPPAVGAAAGGSKGGSGGAGGAGSMGAGVGQPGDGGSNNSDGGGGGGGGAGVILQFRHAGAIGMTSPPVL